jgi:hypothetical protein
MPPVSTLPFEYPDEADLLRIDRHFFVGKNELW